MIIRDEILDKNVKEIFPKNAMDLKIKLRMFLLENGYTLLYMESAEKSLDEIKDMIGKIGYILYIQ